MLKNVCDCCGSYLSDTKQKYKLPTRVYTTLEIERAKFILDTKLDVVEVDLCDVCAEKIVNFIETIIVK